MQYSINEFIKICSNTLPIKGPIYEFGSFQVKGQEHIADLRSMFEGIKYVGTDMRKGIGVDKVMNYQKIPLKNKSISTSICCDTLEHTEYPRKAMKELHRVLKDKGICIITSVFKFPIHDYPYDYFRYTEKAFESLLKDFDSIYVTSYGADEFNPITVVGIGVKDKNFFKNKNNFKTKINQWKEKYDESALREKIYNLYVPLIIRAMFKLTKFIIREIIVRMFPSVHKRIVGMKVNKDTEMNIDTLDIHMATRQNQFKSLLEDKNDIK